MARNGDVTRLLCGTCGNGPCVGGCTSGEGECPKWTPRRYCVNLFDSFVVEAQDEEHAIVAAREHLSENPYLLVPVEIEDGDDG